MKITVIIVRILMGLMYLMASITFFFNLVEVPPMEGSVKTFNEGIAAAVYLFPLVKAIELLCGILFVTGRFVALATVVIFPITINIFLFHAFLAPEGLLIPALLLTGNLFLMYAKRENYAAVFAIR